MKDKRQTNAWFESRLYMSLDKSSSLGERCLSCARVTSGRLEFVSGYRAGGASLKKTQQVPVCSSCQRERETFERGVSTGLISGGAISFTAGLIGAAVISSRGELQALIVGVLVALFTWHLSRQIAWRLLRRRALRRPNSYSPFKVNILRDPRLGAGEIIYLSLSNEALAEMLLKANPAWKMEQIGS